MQPIPGGATARPFVTHHQALDMNLYLRIAPELYLKRLVVGGLDRVFEINRNFRNEGLSIQHNPEFTMLEFYQAYATYEDLMNLTEELISHVAREVLGTPAPHLPGRGDRPDPALAPPGPAGVPDGHRRHPGGGGPGPGGPGGAGPGGRGDPASRRRLRPGPDQTLRPAGGGAASQQPTFITGYPLETSPLSRQSDADPEVVDRFELFIAGREIANAFSELNDPEDQRQRFEKQMAAHAAGDEEMPHALDEDFVTGPGARHAAHRRGGHRHRPPGDAPHRFPLHPGRHPVSAPQAGEVSALGFFESFVALRLLKGVKRQKGFLSLSTFISMAGVMVGVMALIVVIGVMTGFDQDLKKKILSVNAHIIVLKHGASLTDAPQVAVKSGKCPG